MNSFSSKVAIVTGGGSGIGQEVARQLVAQGARVVIGGRDADKLAHAAAAIDAGGERVRAVAGDIADPATAQRLVDEATRAFGGVDILVNNAGIFNPKPFLEVEAAE